MLWVKNEKERTGMETVSLFILSDTRDAYMVQDVG